MNELTFHNFTPSTHKVGGDHMLVLTRDSTTEEVARDILENRVIWILDGGTYHQVFAFDDEEFAIVVYYYGRDGEVVSCRVGDVG